MSEAQKPDIESFLGLLREFSQAVINNTVPHLDAARCEQAYSAAVRAVCSHPCFTLFLNDEPARPQELAGRKLQLVLTHQCKFLGCHKPTCDLCKNNQEKRCAAGDNMDEYYIVNKAIKSKCGADVLVELVDAGTQQRIRDANLQIQVSLTDGDRIEHPGQLEDLADIEIFVNRDSNNQPLLLTSNPVRRDNSGRLLLSMQDGLAQLPEISVSFVTEKLRNENRNIKSFRLLVCAASQYRGVLPEPALSCKFKVITQRAWNDRKATYPHVDDTVSRLDFIGKEAVRKLQNLDQELSAFGFSLPTVPSIQTVGQLKQLKEQMQQDHSLQSTVIRMLNLNHERWGNICHVLDERVVVSDNLPRAFFPVNQDARNRNEGLFYKSRQAKVDLKNPDGLLEKIISDDGQEMHVVTLFTTGSTAVLNKKVEAWRSMAIACWAQEGHPGWCMAPEHRMQGSHSRASPLRPANWGPVVGPTPPGILRAGSLAGGSISAANGPFEVSPHTGGYTCSSPTSTVMHDADDKEEHSTSVNLPSDQFLPGVGAGLARDSHHLGQYYPKRTHSEFIKSQPACMLGDRSESAPEALPVMNQTRERVVVTAGNTPASSLLHRDASHSTASSSSGGDPRPPSNSAMYPSCQAPNMFNLIHNPGLESGLNRGLNQALNKGLNLNQGMSQGMHPGLDQGLRDREMLHPGLNVGFNPRLTQPLNQGVDGLLHQALGQHLNQNLNPNMPASQGLPAGMYAPHQAGPFKPLLASLQPPTSPHAAAPHSPTQPPPMYNTQQHPSTQRRPPSPHSPTQPPPFYNTQPLHPAPQPTAASPGSMPALISSLLASGTNPARSTSAFPLPTPFGGCAPGMEDMLARIVSYIPQHKTPLKTQQQQPVPQQQSPQGLAMPTNGGLTEQQLRDQLGNQDDRLFTQNTAVSDISMPSLLSFEPFPTAVTETLMGLRAITNSLDAPLESMPSISMLVSCSALTQGQLTPTSSGMAWEAMMEAAQQMARLQNHQTEQQQQQVDVALQQQQQQQQQWGS